MNQAKSSEKAMNMYEVDISDWSSNNQKSNVPLTSELVCSDDGHEEGAPARPLRIRHFAAKSGHLAELAFLRSDSEVYLTARDLVL